MLIDGARSDSQESRLRNEPVQARSAARLSALLDAAAEVIEEVGADRMTTAMVADRAGASIGTVYRYFPDRVAVLDGLAHRALTRLLTRIDEAFATQPEASPQDRVDTIVDVLVEFHRREPGYRVLKLGTAVATPGPGGGDTMEQALIRALAGGLREAATEDDDLEFRLRVTLALCEVLVHRAFDASAEGDERLIAEAKSVGGRYLAQHPLD
ncbi:TetR/AcrR family transcriptional regulator [Herbiconiux sp. L3-i23]|uniref:TetR/AcrR family transcriptional regulator n=1 Tax=Herbiconiux sp. L3-i23 TaxID=2905871 RepID=UPI002056ABD6|nr:TetR/AcrR family transcriptional regulator [Herbiconiux sp. L3-i23]BDI23104.1 TetR family transcriptional regulator [Herbiconiux sp. L3-i23]